METASLVIIFRIKIFKVFLEYLYRKSFVILTDCKSPVELFTEKEGMLAKITAKLNH